MKIKTKQLAIASLMIALCGIAGLTSIYIYYDSVKISFLFLPLSVLGSCLPPILSIPAGFVGDFVNWYCKPIGAYFPGYGLSSAISVAIYAVFLYKKDLKLWRVAVARGIILVFIDSLLNMYWGSIVTGKSVSIIFLPRIIKSIIEFPVDVYLIYMFTKLTKKVI